MGFEKKMASLLLSYRHLLSHLYLLKKKIDKSTKNLANSYMSAYLSNLSSNKPHNDLDLKQMSIVLIILGLAGFELL